ncbi:MAG: hypothetical protein M3Z05_22880 [Gemmatimonadota bacterium]|nr:hypothetical protein [Gemmatimonadota bacterium]
MPRRPLGLIALLALVACGSFSGSDAPTTADSGSGDAGACETGTLDDPLNCGACGHACASADACIKGTCTAACAVIFVAPDGDDGRSGCAPSEAKRTLGSAIAVVKAAGAAKHTEIHACAGTYRESRLTLDVAVSLQGGYGCTTFVRSPTYGYPMFDGTNETIIENADALSAATLVVSGTAIDASVIVDGLTLRGSPTAMSLSSALLVAAGASPLLSNNRLLGAVAAGNALLTPTSGLQIASGASPDVTHNRIDGGAGVSASATGSVGVSLLSNGGIPHIHANVIGGGSGSGTEYGSIGLGIAGAKPLTGPTAIEGNTIDGGTGTSIGIDGAAVVGALLDTDAEMALVSNRIYAGTGTCAVNGACAAYGVSSTAPRVRIDANRIYGGDLARAATGTTFLVGIATTKATHAVIVNNMIHTGNKTKATLPNNVYGVQVLEGSGAVVAHNTLVTAPTSGAESAQLVLVDHGAKAVSVDNNLFVGTGSNVSELAVTVTPCNGAALSSLRNNAFVSTGAVLSVITSTPMAGPDACDFATNYATITQAEVAQNNAAATTASGNVRVAQISECGGDVPNSQKCPSPVACAAPYPGCITAVLASFDVASTGFAELDGPGWKLRDHGVCPVMNGGFDLTTTVPTDFFGAMRVAPVSIGAHEDHVCP